jgi:phosphomannomutase
VTIDHLDGTTVQHADWWFNLRPSNTEPLLRLNTEGRDAATMAAIRDAVLTLIRSDS